MEKTALNIQVIKVLLDDEYQEIDVEFGITKEGKTPVVTLRGFTDNKISDEIILGIEEAIQLKSVIDSMFMNAIFFQDYKVCDLMGKFVQDEAKKK